MGCPPPQWGEVYGEGCVPSPEFFFIFERKMVKYGDSECYFLEFGCLFYTQYN